MIQDFILNSWPILNSQKIQWKVVYDSKTERFNAVPTGVDSPLSKCCKMSMCFTFTKDLGGKVLCLDSLCAKNPIETFFVSFNLLTTLFDPQIKDERLK